MITQPKPVIIRQIPLQGGSTNTIVGKIPLSPVSPVRPIVPTAGKSALSPTSPVRPIVPTGAKNPLSPVSPVRPIAPATTSFQYIKGIDVNSRPGVPGYIVPVCRVPSSVWYMQSVAGGSASTKTSSIISNTQHQIQSILNEYTTTLGSESKPKPQDKQKPPETVTRSTIVTPISTPTVTPRLSTTSSTSSSKEVCDVTLFYEKTSLKLALNS